MAIRIVDGVPGAGKTYFAVDHCLKSFYTFDSLTDRWLPKETDTILITNIEGFAIGLQLEEELHSAGDDVEKYFDYEFLAARFESKRVIFIIDEAQQYFHTKFFSKSVFLFFQKHRHLGVDIYFVTQDAALLAKSVRSLAEYVISATKRSMSLGGEFRYRFSDPTTGQAFKTKLLKRDYRVFAVYRSMLQTETEKITSVPLKYMAAFIILVVLVVGGFAYFIKTRYSGQREAMAASTVSKGLAPGGGKVLAGETVRKVEPGGDIEVDPGVDAVVVGRSDFDGVVRVLVQVNGVSFRLDNEALTRWCKCHVESLVVGDVFQAFGRAAASAGGRTRNERARPAPAVHEISPGASVFPGRGK